jgi:peptidylprolyl isomerase
MTQPRAVSCANSGSEIPRRRMGRLAVAALLCLAIGGCDDDSPTSPAPTVADGIWEIAEGADALVTESGLTVIHVEQGTGKQPGRGSIVSVHYTGMLDDGTIFDSSYPRGDPFRFLLGQGRVIAGWDEGIALLRQGGRARLVIPPALGYGQTGAGGTIPPNATLIFDVLLVAVE